MGGGVKAAVRPWIPPRVLEVWHRRFFGPSLTLTDSSWSECASTGPGYQDPRILANVESAACSALAAGRGFERDGLLFTEATVDWSIVGPLFEARVATQGVLRVIDVGGSLASKWIQHRALMDLLSPIRWSVVEQEHYVNAGRRIFGIEDVSFWPDLDDALKAGGGADVVLFSSSLHYFERPMMLLDEACSASQHSVVIDRSPAWSGSEAHLAMQKVSLYERPVEYPCWVLSEPSVMSTLRESFDIVCTWNEVMPIPTFPKSAEVTFLGAAGMGRRR